MPAVVPSAAWARLNKWARSSVVEPQRAGDRVEHRGGRTGDRTAFELRVVLDADPRQSGHLDPSQPRHPPFAMHGEPGLGGGDLGTPRDQELADLVTVVGWGVHRHRRYDLGPGHWDALSVHLTTGSPTPPAARVDWGPVLHESDLI